VRLVLGDKAANWDEAAKVLTTAKGERIPAEVMVWAAGAHTLHALLSGDIARVCDTILSSKHKLTGKTGSVFLPKPRSACRRQAQLAAVHCGW
jgi:hypothetical protein